MTKQYLTQEEFINFVDGLAEHLEYSNEDEYRLALDFVEDAELRTIRDKVFSHPEFTLNLITATAITIRKN